MRNISPKRLLGRKTRTAQPLPAIGLNANQQPFDLAKMQPEPARQKKRQKLLWWSLPFVIIMGAVSLWFLLPTPLTHEAIGSYNHKSYQPARNWLTPLTWTSPQPFVIAFNSGTVDTRLGNYARAQTELTRALELASAAQRCMVLQNLVISLTDHASSLTTEYNSQNAASYTSQADSLKSNNPKCFHVVQVSPKKNRGGGGGGGGGAQVPQILSAAQAEQLDQKNQQGQTSQQQDFGPNANNPNSPANKPW